MQAIKFDITVATDGTYTSSPVTAPGADLLTLEGPRLLHAVEWVKGSLVAGVDAVLSVMDTLSGVDVVLLTLTDANADAWYYPRVAENSDAGAGLTTSTLPVVHGTLKLTVSGGSAGAGGETGKCVVYLL